MRNLNQFRRLNFSQILVILAGGLFGVPYLHNQNVFAIPAANAAEYEQTNLDDQPEPIKTEANPFTPVEKEEQQIEQPLSSSEENNFLAQQQIEGALDSSEENNSLEEITDVSQSRDVEQLNPSEENNSLEEITDVSQLRDVEQLNPSKENSSLDQITNVSQLRDVQPADWAYEALRSLVERYGCIAGYPDGTFRGNRAMTRYEFAAGLNACLQQIEKLIAAGTSDFVTREDLATLQRLVDDFNTELETLGTRVDDLEGRTAFLEEHQFSTTTKLNGEAIFALASSLNEKDDIAPSTTFEDEATLSDRIQLNFDASFTGKDLLRVTLATGNVQVGTGMAFLNYGEYTDNDFALRDLWYTFPVGDSLRFIVGANDTSFDDFAIGHSPYFAYIGSGALSFFGAYNFVVYPYSADQLFAGNIKFSDSISLDVGYFTNQPNLPTAKNGLFNGDFGVSAQLNLNPTETWDIGLAYTYTFQPGKDVTLTDTIGSPIADNPFGEATAAHRFGVMTNWNITPKINLGGWLGYINAEAKSGLREGDSADIFTWAATLALSDIGKEGSVLGLIVGMPPKATDVEGGPEDEDTSLLVEAHYRYPISDNILITPGIFVIFNPDHDNANDDIFVGIIRTTFTF
ncbi:MAG: carbohydrate porin [Tolypothrix sp. T3-bin4]|nr:carbohydrate porin [Tolypothrix sp. T3-bin4]